MKVLIDPYLRGNPAALASPEELDPDAIAVTHGPAWSSRCTTTPAPG